MWDAYNAKSRGRGGGRRGGRKVFLWELTSEMKYFILNNSTSCWYLEKQNLNLNKMIDSQYFPITMITFTNLHHSKNFFLSFSSYLYRVCSYIFSHSFLHPSPWGEQNHSFSTDQNAVLEGCPRKAQHTKESLQFYVLERWGLMDM